MKIIKGELNISSISTVIVWGIVLFLLSGFSGASRKQLRNYVVLVSFDAFRWDYGNLYKTPFLDKMAADGVKAGKLISSFPTNTFPNHYSIATGLYPDHHGLVNNSFYAPDLDLGYRIGDRQAVENPGFYGGEPIWNTAQRQGLKSASFFWVGSEAPVNGKHPTYWKKYDEAVTYGERIDTVIKWLGYPEAKRPALVTLYFDEPDATAHDFGPVSPETGAVVSELDSLLGVLMHKLSQLPIARKINLIVLSDHGMAHVTSERYINIRSILPERMISSMWGGNPVYLINPAEGKTDSILLFLNNVRGMKAWRKNELPARWNFGTHPRIPEIVAVADSSWYVGTRPFFGTLNGGAHGYDNRNPDMHGIFFAAGPEFRKNHVVGELKNTDIYNIICRILGITPAPNDGNPDVLKEVLRN